ncbi:MAG: penicillin-binding transpeptidase domain-containing protein [Roseburia sp.]|nr:penicillin-binding transpeptidase domain-containing protein [Roseburia sp.]
MSAILAIAFIFCIIFARFFYIQAVWGSELVYRATDQWNREIPVIAARGQITDRNGQLIAGNRATYSVFVRPNAVTDAEGCALALSEILGLDRIELLNRLSSKKVSEITVARQVEKERIEELSARGFDGVYYSRDNTRTYAYNDALCQVLGFTASDGTGLSGIEKYYDNVLSGKNGEIAYTTDIVGVQTENSEIVYREAVAGDGIMLTIDMDIQLAAEQAMRSVYLSSNAKRVSCVVLDPNDFGVLAMVNYPSYDLNDVPRDDTEALNALSRNGIVSDIYEPGSTFKVVTAAANIEEYLRGNRKAFSDTYIFNGSRTRTVDGTKIKCWSDHANGKHSNQTLASALNNSCNPCFTDMALALGTDTFYNYLTAFGLGNVTGLDFNGEALGMLVPKSLVRDCDLARIGFGQTVAVSGLQLACATAAAVNGGNYYTPHFLKGIVSSDGKRVEEYTPLLKGKPISARASEMLAEMLEGVVREGSGKKAYIEGYKVGGKTGTAQKYEDGHIASGKYVSSFVGFFPSDSPRYLALIIVDEPEGTYYGSAVAAPVAREIFSDIIKIKNIGRFE